MTLNEITTTIAARMDRQFDLQYRQWLVPKVEAWRSRLIRNTLSKSPMERSQFVQAIRIPLTYSNGVNRSEPIPTLLRIGPVPFDYVGPADLSSPFRFNDPGTSHFVQLSKIGGKFPYYEIPDNRVIIRGLQLPEVTGVGIFDEPSKIMEWQCGAGVGNCDWWNAPYPISGDVLAMANTAIWEELGLPKETLPKTQKQDG